MKSLKKAVVLVLSILIILTLTNCSFARAIGSTSNSTNNTSNDTNNTENSTDNEVDNNTTNNTTNNTSSGNTAAPVISNNTPRAINSSNVSENLPNTGLSSAELNLALILLLALVFGMFSLVQYNKIVKKDNEE